MKLALSALLISFGVSSFAHAQIQIAGPGDVGSMDTPSQVRHSNYDLKLKDLSEIQKQVFAKALSGKKSILYTQDKQATLGTDKHQRSNYIHALEIEFTEEGTSEITLHTCTESNCSTSESVKTNALLESVKFSQDCSISEISITDRQQAKKGLPFYFVKLVIQPKRAQYLAINNIAISSLSCRAPGCGAKLDAYTADLSLKALTDNLIFAAKQIGVCGQP